MKPTFNLVEHPWLPVLGRDGKVREVGIEEALLQAHDFVGLRDDSPLTTAALLRLLLAVVHAAIDGPRSLDDWASLWTAGRLPEAAPYSQYS